MSEMEKLALPDALLEQLRCSLCKGYLSCAPVQLLSNGRSICGHCTRSTENGPTYRQLTFEAMLSTAFFPCRFQEYGCEKRIQFGHTSEHEVSCLYRPTPCPSLPSDSCQWKGSIIQILDHFKENHSELVKQKVVFNIPVDETEQEIVLAEIYGVVFIAKYMYNATSRVLLYDVNTLTLNHQEARYKVKLINDLVCDNSITLKGDTCLPYVSPLCDLRGDMKMDFFLPVLDNPNRFIFEIDLTVGKYEELSGSEYQLDEKSVFNNSSEVSANNPSTVDEILEKPKGETSESTCSCSWEGCSFLGTSGDVKEHKMVCPFRLCGCTAEVCENRLFKPESILTHLLTHGFYYINNEFDCKMIFSQADEQKSFFSLQYNGIIYIEHKARMYRGSNHEISVHTYDSYKPTNQVSAVLEFENSQCKYKTRVFTIFSWGGKSFDLPSGFKTEDQFSATLRIL